jgi:hypothetical protein
VVRRLRQCGKIRVALDPPDLGEARIDRIDLARIAAVAQIAEDLRRLSRALGRAHDGDGGGIEQRQRRLERIASKAVLQLKDS